MVRRAFFLKLLNQIQTCMAFVIRGTRICSTLFNQEAHYFKHETGVQSFTRLGLEIYRFQLVKRHFTVQVGYFR